MTRLLLILAIALSPIPCFADGIFLAETGSKKVKTSTKKSTTTKTNKVAKTAGTSTSKKQNKSLLFLLRASPLAFTKSGPEDALPLVGVDGYYFMSPSLMIGGYVSYAAKSLVDQLEGNPLWEPTRADVKSAQFMVGARYFLWNSLYVGTGFGYRSLTMDINIRARLDSSIGADIIVNGTAFPVDLTVGNLWCFDFGFCAGADWVGRTHPFGPNYELVITEYGVQSTPEAVAEIESAIDDVNQQSLGMYLVINLGYKF
ncbi:MAG: hypothetical protein AB7T49_07095 [Oligoflexales bacterium]